MLSAVMTALSKESVVGPTGEVRSVCRYRGVADFFSNLEFHENRVKHLQSPAAAQFLERQPEQTGAIYATFSVKDIAKRKQFT